MVENKDRMVLLLKIAALNPHCEYRADSYVALAGSMEVPGVVAKSLTLPSSFLTENGNRIENRYLKGMSINLNIVKKKCGKIEYFDLIQQMNEANK